MNRIYFQDRLNVFPLPKIHLSALHCRQLTNMLPIDYRILRQLQNHRIIPHFMILFAVVNTDRGGAGVGKSTLCKKLVHDFICGQLWSDLFDRIIWLPLRDLKERPTLQELLDSYLQDSSSGLAGEFTREQQQNTLAT